MPVDVGNDIKRKSVRIDPKKIVIHATKFPSLVEIVLTSFSGSHDIHLVVADGRIYTIRSYRPKVSLCIPKGVSAAEYQEAKKMAGRAAEKEYDKIMEKIRQGKYNLHLYDDGRIDLKLT